MLNQLMESLVGSEVDPIIQKIGDAIKESGKPLMGLRPVLEKLFPKKDIDFNYAGSAHFEIDYKGKSTIITNKKYVDDAELVIGELAIGFNG